MSLFLLTVFLMEYTYIKATAHFEFDTLKPYWSKSLNDISKSEKRAWKIWKHNGKPKDGIAYEQYKLAKREFRAARRKAEQQYEIQQMDKIAKMEQIDQPFFWHLINKSRNKPKRSHNPLEQNGSILTDPKDVFKAWESYFMKLYTPSNKPHYDDRFMKHIETEVKRCEEESLRKDTYVLRDPLVPEEIRKEIRKLKLKKAPGWDNVTTEHIRYGGDILLEIITYIFNAMTVTEYIPGNLKKGIIVPIPKGNKDATKMDNNRGITLLPILSKLYEKVLLTRHEMATKDMAIIDSLQGAMVMSCSSMHTTWMLRETIAYNLEKKSSIYVGLLDTSKAFDSVWVDGAFYKLHRPKAMEDFKKLLQKFCVLCQSVWAPIKLVCPWTGYSPRCPLVNVSICSAYQPAHTNTEGMWPWGQNRRPPDMCTNICR